MKKYQNIFSVVSIGLSTVIVGLISYLYHPLMIRYLDLKTFAEFESLLGIINILSVISTAFALFFVKEYTKITTQESESLALYHFMKKFGLFIGTITFLLYVIFSPLLAYFLHIDDYSLIILVGGVLFLGFSFFHQGVFLQSNKHFGIIAISNVVNPILRVGIGFGLVFLGFGVFGALGGFIISQIILIFITFLYIQTKLNTESYDKKGLEKKLIKDFLKQKKQILHFFFSTLLLAILINIDILFAKHFFEAEEAGAYAGISIIAKFLVFIGMSIETVYYPILTSEAVIQKQKFFLLSILYIIMTLGALLFFYLFGEYILYIFKPGFEKYLHILYFVIIYCGALSLLNFLVKVLIAFEKYFINYMVAIMIVLGIICLYIFVDGSLINLVYVFDVMILLLLLLGYIFFIVVKNEK